MKNAATTIVLAGVMVLGASACAPVLISKCQKDIVYDPAGKAIGEYTECVNQTPNSLPPVHLRHDELLK